MSRRQLTALLLISPLLGGAAVAAILNTSCHIHPPAQASDAPVASIGPFTNAEQCEAARARMFGDLGRCHCSRGFFPMRGSDGMRPQPAAGEAPREILP